MNPSVTRRGGCLLESERAKRGNSSGILLEGIQGSPELVEIQAKMNFFLIIRTFAEMIQNCFIVNPKMT